MGGLAVAGLAVTSGCALHLDDTTKAPALPARDAPLVHKAIRESQAAQAVVTAASVHHALAGDLGPLVAMHHDHVRLLVRSLGRRRARVDSDHGVFASTTRAQALAQVRAAEVRLAGELVALAQRAHDGDLARVLAAMAAAVDQRLTVMAGVHA